MANKSASKKINVDCVIDFGFVNVVTAYMNTIAKQVMCVPVRDGGYSFPSAVYLESEEHAAIGRPAKEREVIEPEKVVTHFKRKLGTAEKIKIGTKVYSAEQMAALVIKEAIINTEQELGKKVENVLLTVPAVFSTHARAAIIRAAEIAGLNVVGLLDEPIAVAISYFESKKSTTRKKETILLADIGGGTSDFFVAERQGRTITPIMKDGDFALGGNDWSVALENYTKEKMGWTSSPDQHSKQEEQVLKMRVEEMKKHLSKLDRDQVLVTQGGTPKIVSNTRSEFESCTVHLQNRFKKDLKEMKEKLETLGKRVPDVVVLSGGASHMPHIADIAKDIFPDARIEAHNYDYAVAKGAAIYASKPEKYSIIGKSYGVRVLTKENGPKINNILLASQPCPVTGKRMYEAACDNQARINLKIYESHAIEKYMEEDKGTFLGNLFLLLPQGIKKGDAIEVGFELDKSGILIVNAKETKSGRAVKASFNAEGVLGYKPAEVQKKEIENYLKNLEG